MRGLASTANTDVGPQRDAEEHSVKRKSLLDEFSSTSFSNCAVNALTLRLVHHYTRCAHPAADAHTGEQDLLLAPLQLCEACNNLADAG